MNRRKKICIDVNSIIQYFIRGSIYGVGGTTLELVESISLVKDEFEFEIELFSQNMKGIGAKSLDLPLKKLIFSFLIELNISHL